MIGSCIRALSRASRRLGRTLSIGIVTALVAGLALVATPTQSATAAPAPGASAQTGASAHAPVTKKAKKGHKAKKKKKTRSARAIRRVKSRAGAAYRYGADGPHSFDCSGLTRWVYKKLGHKLPHSSSAQVSHTFKVKKPRRGDLVFFYGSNGVYHVGIFAGTYKGKRWVWHAPRSGEVVKKQPIWTSSYFIRRVKYKH